MMDFENKYFKISIFLRAKIYGYQPLAYQSFRSCNSHIRTNELALHRITIIQQAFLKYHHRVVVATRHYAHTCI